MRTGAGHSYGRSPHLLVSRHSLLRVPGSGRGAESDEADDQGPGRGLRENRRRPLSRLRERFELGVPERGARIGASISSTAANSGAVCQEIQPVVAS